MRKRWKRLAAILGAAVLVVCQNGAMQVKAEEALATEESVLTEETGDKGDASQKKEDVAEEAMTEKKEDSGEKEAEGTKDGASEEETTETKETKEDDAVPEGEDPDAQKEKTSEYIKEKPEDAEEKAIKMDVTGRQTKEAAENKGESASLAAAENLVWDADEPGLASFVIPNQKGAASYKVDLWCDGKRVMTYAQNEYADKDKGEKIDLYLFHFIKKTGKYRFQVAACGPDGKAVNEAFSAEWNYTVPGEQLPIPTNVSWDEDGIFSCGNPDKDKVKQYVFHVYLPDGNLACQEFGSPVIGDRAEDEEGITFNLNKFLEGRYGITPGNGYCVEVQATSNDINVCRDSEWSNRVMFGNGASQPVPPDSSSSGSQNTGKDKEESNPSGSGSIEPSENGSGDSSGSSFQAVPAVEWKPTTPDEIKRYAAYSREKAEYTADARNAYTVVVQNAMQGKKCFDSFEAVLGGYTIGRTYNILPSGKVVYKMDSKARITLTIPKGLQKVNRDFKMVCVTEDGVPVVLNDLDSNPETVTFETDVYYAFALVYKDAVASK